MAKTSYKVLHPVKDSPLEVRSYSDANIVRSVFRPHHAAAADLIDSILSKAEVNFSIWNPAKFFINDTYRASAKCNVSMGDTFDESVGYDLARKRVMSKYHRQVDKKLNDFLVELHTAEAAVLKYMTDHGITLTAKSCLDIYVDRYVTEKNKK